MEIEIEPYMLSRLLATSKKMYPEEGDDITLAVGMLIEEHKMFQQIVSITKGMIPNVVEVQKTCGTCAYANTQDCLGCDMTMVGDDFCRSKYKHREG